MKRSSSKISFDVQQRAIPKTVAPKAAAHKAAASGAHTSVDASRGGVKEQLPLPPVRSTPDKKADVAPQSSDKLKLGVADKPKASRRPTPKPPHFAATGLMAQEQDGFFRRNAKPLGFAGGAALIFVLGVMTAFSLGDDAEPLSFSAATSLPVQETPTRSVAADLTDVSAATDIRTDISVEKSEPVQTALSQDELAGLRPVVQPAAPQTQAPQTQAAQTQAAPDVAAETLLDSVKLHQLREGVLEGGYSVEVIEKDGARRVELVMQNINMTAGHEEELLVEAAQEGLLELSGALRTPEGDLDTKTMIFDVVQRSLLADETSASSEAALDMSRKVFAASVARTQFVNGRRMYTVQPGDSLAYIALQFFGMPEEYDRILEANRNTLQSPDKIQIGQRLIIPS